MIEPCQVCVALQQSGIDVPCSVCTPTREEPPPAFTTGHRSPCIGCGTTILPGDEVRAFEEGYVHAHGCPPAGAKS